MTCIMGFDLRITELDDSGFGRAKALLHDKEIVTRVFGALPQEKISTSTPQHFHRNRRDFIAVTEQVVEASPCRVESRCAHVGHCGGCLLQHMSYKEQTRWKQEKVTSLFAPVAHPETIFLPCIGADTIWSYRNKMEFSFSQDAALHRFLGLFSLTKSQRIEMIHECHIGPSWTAEALSRIYDWWGTSTLQAYHPHQDTGSLRTVAFRASRRMNDNMIILTVSGRPEWAISKEDLKSFVEAIIPLEQKYGGVFSCILRIQQAIKGQATQWYEMVLHGNPVICERYKIANFGEMELQFSPQSFAQPNSEQAEKIYSSALNMLQLDSEDILWDLFCGVGGFGLAASSVVKKVVGIELSVDSVYDATCNKERVQRKNFQVEKGDVFELVASPDAMQRLGKPSKIVVDPPRSGLGPKVVQLLHSLLPQAIVYVSCNPESQYRDVQLFHAAGWKVCAVQPIDQFPHTPHLENIVLLKRL